jgi:hypothetical protein
MSGTTPEPPPLDTMTEEGEVVTIYPRRVLAITGVGPSKTGVWYFGESGSVEHLIIFSPACFVRQMLKLVP